MTEIINKFKKFYPRAAQYLNDNADLLDTEEGRKEFLYKAHPNHDIDNSEGLGNLEVYKMNEVINAALRVANNSISFNMFDVAKECLLESFIELCEKAPENIIDRTIWEALVNNYGDRTNLFGLKMDSAIKHIEANLDKTNVKLRSQRLVYR